MFGLSDVLDVVEGAGDAAADVVGDIADEGSDLLEGAEDLLSDSVDLLNQAFDDVASLAEDALNQIGDSLEVGWDQASRYVDEAGDAIEVAWEVTSAAVDDAWNALESTVDEILNAAEQAAGDAWDELTSVAESAWDELSDDVDALWHSIETAGLTAAEWGVAGYEWALDVIEEIAYWIGDLGDEIKDLIVKLGACLAGQVVYRLAKAANLIASFGKPIKQLPTEFVIDLGNLYEGTLQSDVWYIEDVNLVANWFTEGEPTSGMTFAGVTIAGFNISYVVFLKEPWDQQDDLDREVMAHELVHVQQYRSLRFESVFACGYGIGFVEAGFDYRTNPFEAEAFNFVDVHRTEIDR